MAAPMVFRRALAWAVGLVALAGIVLRPSPARAYEDQVTVGVDAGYALAKIGQPQSGLTLGADASVGLGDMFSLRARVGYGYHPAHEGLHVLAVGAEVIYLLDVLEWVPYFGLGADGFVSVASGGARGDLGLHAVLGLEWLASRDWLLGLDLRPYVLPLAFGDAPLDPVYFTATLRFSLIFDL